MKKSKGIPCTRCRMGVPIGVTIALIGLVGIITGSLNYDVVGIFGIIPFIGLFLVGPPFARMASLVNGAHARIDKLDESVKK